MKQVVVTGGTGFLGYHLLQELIKNNVKVYAVVRPSSCDKLIKSELIVPVMCELDNISDLSKKIKNQEIDTFYHFAWRGIRNDNRNNAKIQKLNYNNSIEAYKVANELKCKTFVGVGSQAEYGNNTSLTDETCPLNPTTEYGINKANTFYHLEQLAKSCNTNFIWSRIYSVYGPLDYENSLVSYLIRSLKNNEIPKVSKGDNLWNFIYVTDCINSIIALAETKSNIGAVNIAHPVSMPLKNYIQKINEIVNSQVPVDFSNISSNISLNPSIKKLIELTDWKPKFTFESGIEFTANYQSEV